MNKRIVRYSIVIVIVGLIVGCGEEEPPTDEPPEGMVLIPAGEFEMGIDSSDIPDLVQWAKRFRDSVTASLFVDETPRHTVYLDAFYMDIYEVTNAQYQKFMDSTGHAEPQYWNESGSNAPQQPVVAITWHDAVAYAEWAGKRLPTEAEWEKAARGGLVGKRYSWGDEISRDDANYNDIGGKDVWSFTSPVGSFAANGYGLYDMAGNMWEWCADWYDEGYYANSPRNNPLGPDSGSHRVLRGGSWHHGPYALRVAGRDFDNPASVGSRVGFRCISQD